jgi:hypothetical protein
MDPSTHTGQRHKPEQLAEQHPQTQSHPDRRAADTKAALGHSRNVGDRRPRTVVPDQADHGITVDRRLAQLQPLSRVQTGGAPAREDSSLSVRPRSPQLNMPGATTVRLQQYSREHGGTGRASRRILGSVGNDLGSGGESGEGSGTK